MLTAQVNNRTFSLASSPDGLLVNGEKLDWDVVEISVGYFHIIHNNQSYRAEVVKADPAAKAFTIKINGTKYEVMVKDRFDLLLEKLGMNSASAGALHSIKAPMPGLIVDLKVAVGDTVHTGDALLILEAMKMENVLKASGPATVKTVKVKKGDSVEKGQVLIEFGS
ncbi:MAG: biotin/lipoyl-binding protein [Flammeovirgaceae bacterium]|nr:MAG: biotin/lipoyl-binding protein [Flammeovirgaceae bacterium]